MIKHRLDSLNQPKITVWVHNTLAYYYTTRSHDGVTESQKAAAITWPIMMSHGRAATQAAAVQSGR